MWLPRSFSECSAPFPRPFLRQSGLPRWQSRLTLPKSRPSASRGFLSIWTTFVPWPALFGRKVCLRHGRFLNFAEVKFTHPS